MANTLVSGWKPGSQTNYEYRPNHEQHLEVLSHLLYFKSFFQWLSWKLPLWLDLWSWRRGSLCFYRRFWLWINEVFFFLFSFALVVLEMSHFMKMRTGGLRCPARYPYLAPAPRPATVSPCGGSSSTPLRPIKKDSRESFLSTRKKSGNPRRASPSAPALAYSTS